jgi:hypothetical protein
LIRSLGSIADIREQLGDDYAEEVPSLQEFLCGYFDAAADCNEKQGSSVSPVAGAPPGGKGLKVRWHLPGEGKSGGLRLAVVAFCDESTVVVCEAFRRRGDPSAEEFAEAMTAADGELDY